MLYDLDGVIRSTLVDKMMFSDIYDASFKLRDTSRTLTEKGIPNSDTLVFDVWSSLYKVAPQFKDAEQVPNELKVNEKIMRTLHSMPEYINLKKHCTLDELMAAIGTLKLAEDIEKIVDRNLTSNINYRKAVEKLKKADSLNTLAETIEQTGDDALNGSQLAQMLAGLIGQNAADDILNSSSAGEAAAKLKKAADDLAQEFTNELSDILEDSGLQKQLRKAVRNTLKDVETLGEALSQFRGCGSGAGMNSQLDANLIVRSAEYLMDLPKNRKKVLEIMKLAGQMSRAALSKRKARVEVAYPEQWDGYEEGNEIERLIPQELLAFRHPAMKRDFLKRFADKKLQQYKIDPVQYAGNGPIVVCVDESESMEGQKETWAKAVALALFNIAMKKRRPFALIRFSDSTETPLFVHPKKKVKLHHILQELEQFICGGTNFQRPLQEAMNIINTNKTYKKADIIFITDGECFVPNDFLQGFLEAKKKKKISVFSILIGYEARGVADFSDMVYRTNAEKTEDGTEVLSLFLEASKDRQN